MVKVTLMNSKTEKIWEGKVERFRLFLVVGDSNQPVNSDRLCGVENANESSLGCSGKVGLVLRRNTGNNLRLFEGRDSWNLFVGEEFS
jgi:hypothetical protein